MSGYCLYHSIGTYPAKQADTAQALAQFAEIWSREDDNQWPQALGARDRFIRSWERLIRAPEGTMTTVENVTVALSSLIGALPGEYLRGKRVLIAEDCFPSLHFLLAGLEERFGFRLDTVPLRQGQAYVEDEDYLEHWGEDVGLAVITWVTSTASKRADLSALAARARETRALTVVDITQGVGILPFAVGDFDVVIGSSLKWLCGFSGAGMLYVRTALLDRCEPELRGWFSQPNPFSWALDSFSYAPDARRFDHGTPAVLAAVASQPGLDFVLDTGVEVLRAHNLRLTRQLIAMAPDLGLVLASPVQEDRRGGSVMLKAQSVERAKVLVAHLKSQQIFVDHRGETLRFSPGIVTSEADLARLPDLIGSYAA
ncbi:aminotransferase class V-fold PLP-dependent enzyme [Allorhizobium taibaishanense]|uniref:Class V aminotransferase n=1 Tax=Allorhizobium taibaishanense TaxID=887144 RepID=A0A1Q9A3H7_9HYPH|nr:aminotransferase class V-fold PLP-dependent enzyme [Allorhizobium taibaishanense]MBB4006123.1 selenocysteine lyase/cysteine desulfurase [Allorhizobium taibaishanense]OLP49123.1 class V aminotransferase [Allorhizobium taibaishanense]